MSHPPATKLDPGQLALALLLLSPSVACHSRTADVGGQFDLHDVVASILPSVLEVR